MKRHSTSLLKKSLTACACASSLLLTVAHAQRIRPDLSPKAAAAAQPVKTVFYILIENRNFTAGTDTTGGSVLVGNSAAPYINSLITPNGANSAQVSYCTAYHHVLSTTTGNNPSIHPSEPNYVWMEAGSNLSKLDDNDPYGSSSSVSQILNYLSANPALTGQHLSGLLQASGISWKSYQEGIDHLTSTNTNGNLGLNGGTLTTTVAPQSTWTVPLASFSGTSATYTNAYNGSHQYNFACKHNGSLFFLDTNGSSANAANTSTTNPVVSNYAPLEQLATDLSNNTVARYNIITPDQYNDMHTALTGGFTYNGTKYTGDLAQVAQGDNFLSILIPQIMASQAYQNNGAIVIWTDETEGTNQNDFNHTLMEIVLSPLAKGNAYASTVNLTHSSDIATMQEIYQVSATTSTGYLNDAANVSNSSGAAAGTATGFGTATALDMADLFQPGAIPAGLPSTRINASGYTVNGRAKTAVQTVTMSNALSTPITTPIYLAVGNLNTTLINSAGTTQNNAPLGAPYVYVASGLAAGASASVTLQFALPASGGVTDTLNAVTTAGQP